MPQPGTPPRKSWRVKLCLYCDEKSASIRTFSAAETAPSGLRLVAVFFSVRQSQTPVILHTKTCDYNSSRHFVIARSNSTPKNSRKIYRVGESWPGVSTKSTQRPPIQPLDFDGPHPKP